MARSDILTSAIVLRTAKIDDSGQIDDDIVQDAISEAQDEVYSDYGDPLERAYFYLDNSQLRYEFRNDNKQVFRIDKVIIYDNDNVRKVYTADTVASETNQKYIEDLEFNTITFAQDTVNAYSGRRCVVEYVPQYLYDLARTKAALYILDYTNTSNYQEGAPTLGTRLYQRIQRIEGGLALFKACGSEDEKNYDITYGTFIPQKRFWTYT